ncbi:MAG: glucokinase [Proteobacteria bacterium]|nr:glucokinase [Pseudomonadota bacterium]
MILGGDLGGTKTLLALAEIDDGRLKIFRQQRYASQDYPSFDDLLAEFIPDQPNIASACFGVAGPTDGREAKLTYLPWQLSAGALEDRFGIGQVSLLNDFAAAAHGVPLVEDRDILTLHAGQPEDGAPRVILGAGTGLGVAGLIWQDGACRVIPGEGGHFGFAPQTPQQGELWRWLQAQYGRVTVEDIVSGPGLSRIFTFLSGQQRAPEEISQAALAGSDQQASAALRLWLECYGAFAGDLAMHWLARGGVYLAGGIAAKLLPHIDAAPFTDAFLAKREHRELVKKMPIRLLTVEDLGLRGTLARATQQR